LLSNGYIPVLAILELCSLDSMAMEHPASVETATGEIFKASTELRQQKRQLSASQSMLENCVDHFFFWKGLH